MSSFCLTRSALENLKGLRWSDPWLKPAEDVGSISPDSISFASTIIKQTFPQNDAEVARWFGCHAGAPRTGEDEDAEQNEVSVEELLDAWEHQGLVPREDLRFAFVDNVADGSLDNGLFFANGDVGTSASPAAMQIVAQVIVIVVNCTKKTLRLRSAISTMKL